MKLKTVLIVLFFSIVLVPSVWAAPLWRIQSIDTMKVSRDNARQQDILQKIPGYVDAVASLSPSYIAIGTPYNDEFYTVLKAWVDQARKHGLKVWFRGNFSEWEGWFNYPKFSDYHDDHQKVYNFITQHPELFQDGDIFTPVSEPENGGLGDPRGSEEKTIAFNQFLIDSYNTCDRARRAINKLFLCGYFSMNGDVASQSLTPDTVAKTGGVVVIDHYVKDPNRLVADIKALAEKDNAPVILGEIGAPIPDIHGSMTDEEQASYIGQTLEKVAALGDMVGGLNYWTAFDGSTRIFDNDLTPRPIAQVITSYFNVSKVSGIVEDQFGNRIENFTVSGINGDPIHFSDSQGTYKISIPGASSHVTFDAGSEYKTVSIDLEARLSDQVNNVVLERINYSFFEGIKLSVTGLIEKFVTRYAKI